MGHPRGSSGWWISRQRSSTPPPPPRWRVDGRNSGLDATAAESRPNKNMQDECQVEVGLRLRLKSVRRTVRREPGWEYAIRDTIVNDNS